MKQNPVPQNYRMVWIGRDLLRSSSPTSCHRQGHFSLDQVAQAQFMVFKHSTLALQSLAHVKIIPLKKPAYTEKIMVYITRHRKVI